MFTIEEIVKATKAKLVQGSKTEKITSVSTDTREIKPGAVFIALKGKKFDGHCFIREAIQKGAKAILASRYQKIYSASVSILHTDDTLWALGEMARCYRKRFTIPTVAITASAGKTTTKEMIASVLSKKYCVLKNFSTENNEIGVSKTIFQLREKHDVMVLEFGTNHFGEIKRLTRIACPSVAVILNIGKSHLEFLKNLQGVFREKSSLYRNMEKTGVLVYNYDDQKLCLIEKQQLKHKKISFGMMRGAGVQAQDITFIKGKIHFCVQGESFSILGASFSMVYNALAAIACGRLFKVDVGEMQKSLKALRPPSGRQEFYQSGDCWIINDAYNANPLSVSAALEALKNFSTKGRRVFIFGDMLELGKDTKKEHEALGRKIIESGVDVLVTVGKFSPLCAGFLKNKSIQIVNFSTSHYAAPRIKRLVQKGDVILVKGSRSLQMEKILEFFKKIKFNERYQ